MLICYDSRDGANRMEGGEYFRVGCLEGEMLVRYKQLRKVMGQGY